MDRTSAEESTVVDVDLRKLFSETRTVAIVGLSDNPVRTSHRIAKYLKNEAGYRIIPVNPTVAEVLGEKSYPDLLSIPADIVIDIVNVFRRSEHLEAVAREAVQRGCRFFWSQLGVYSQKAEEVLRDAKLPFVMNRCIFVEHQNLFH
ncbi:MAG TPA: CoA-binding protein [bacterium]|nr:CoA-binding protein [bacterium]